jgi:hypothetical protein
LMLFFEQYNIFIPFLPNFQTKAIHFRWLLIFNLFLHGCKTPLW